MAGKFFIIYLLCISFCSVCTLANETANVVRLGKQAESQADYGTAIRCYTRLINECNESSKPDTTLCKGLLAGGNCCASCNRYVEALQFYTLAIEQAEKCGRLGVKLSCLNNIGSVYALFNDFERASHYYEEAYNLAIKCKNDKMLSILAINLVKIYSQLGDIKTAKEFLHQQMSYPHPDKYINQYYVLRNQGMIAKADNNYSLAESFFEQAKETVKRHNLGKDDLADVFIEMGEMRKQQRRSTEAVAYFANAINAAKNGNHLFQLQEAYKKIADTYKEMNMNDSAEHFQSLYAELSDSIFNQRMFNNVKNNLFKYEDRINNEHIGFLENTIGGLAVAISTAVAFMLFVLYHNRKLRTAHKLLIVKNEELIRQARENRILREVDKTRTAEIPNNDTATGKDGDSNLLTEEKRNELVKAILAVMDNTEAISDPEFNLNSLSKTVGSNSKYVSLAIKDTYQKNFKTFLNEYRIREASIRLADKENYGMLTISAIGESVGFTSPNGFIIAFKKIVGMTPSVYKRLKDED